MSLLQISEIAGSWVASAIPPAMWCKNVVRSPVQKEHVDESLPLKGHAYKGKRIPEFKFSWVKELPSVLVGNVGRKHRSLRNCSQRVVTVSISTGSAVHNYVG